MLANSHSSILVNYFFTWLYDTTCILDSHDMHTFYVLLWHGVLFPLVSCYLLLYSVLPTIMKIFSYFRSWLIGFFMLLWTCRCIFSLCLWGITKKQLFGVFYHHLWGFLCNNLTSGLSAVEFCQVIKWMNMTMIPPIWGCSSRSFQVRGLVARAVVGNDK